MRGIAAGTAQRFVSRNNDVRGYWALGILYKTAVDAGTDTLVLNLCSGESSPSFAESSRVAKTFLAYVRERLSAKGFSDTQLSDAHIELKFDVAPTPPADGPMDMG